MVETVHDAVEGRVRYRVRGLYRSKELRRQIETRLQGEAGIRCASASVLTGNVLVLFDRRRNPAEIAELIEHLASSNGEVLNLAPYLTGDNGSRSEPASAGNLLPRATADETSPHGARATHDTELWHERDASWIIDHFHSSAQTGLSTHAAVERLESYGPNRLPEIVPPSVLTTFLEQFVSLPVALLGAAAGISVLTGGVADAVVIGAVVLINATIGCITERQADRTIRSLSESASPGAIVVRDRQIRHIQADDVVPGDLLVLKRGIYVTADARLIEARDLRVDESALTGESVPVDKNTDIIPWRDVPLGDCRNMVFRGTVVTGGFGAAIVVATGRRTEMGQIQLLVAEAGAPSTPLEKQLDQLGRQLVYLSGGICALVLVVGVLRGSAFLPMAQSALSLAVAAVPEGLPAVATTTLALGITNMRRRRVLIRRLKAVETLGAVHALCFDKTGTLTINRMSVRAIHAGGRRFSVHDGQVWCDGVSVQAATCKELLLLTQVGVLCTESEVTRHDNTVVVQGSSTENGLFQLASDAGLDVASLFEDYPVVRVKERGENANYMVTLHQSNTGRRFLAMKGNPEEVLALCDRQMRAGEIVPLTDPDLERIRGENEFMAADALRVLGMAYAEGDGDANELDNGQHLVWLGMTGMADPLRSGLKELIATFHRAGIDTVMITGDQSLTAHAVGKELGLSRKGDVTVLDSVQARDTEPQFLEALARNIDVFARVSPANKLHIVQSMQRGGSVVAMLGDGINDGPALKAADVGVAMGKSGTRTAREVADVLLEDDNLETMIDAIALGRTTYENIRKAIHYILATNLSEIMIVGTAVSSGLGQPLSTRQLLWINLVSDIFPEMALAMEAPQPDVMSRPPREPNEPVVRTDDFKRIAFEGGTITAASLAAYGYGLARYGAGQRAGTISFMSLTAGQLLHVLSCRSERYGIFSSERLPTNPYLNATLGFSLLLQVFAIAIPGLRSFLGLTPIALLDAAVVGGAAVAPLLINEATKGGAR